MRNEEVIARWLGGKSVNRKDKALSTDGGNLYSYSVRIGRRNGLNYVQIAKPFYSVTTARHCNLAARIASDIGYKVERVHWEVLN